MEKISEPQERGGMGELKFRMILQNESSFKYLLIMLNRFYVESQIESKSSLTFQNPDLEIPKGFRGPNQSFRRKR